MMPKNLLLLSMLLLVFSGCYDSLTKADLCNDNFEDCSQYESHSSGSNGSNGSGGLSGSVGGTAQTGPGISLETVGMGEFCTYDSECEIGFCQTFNTHDGGSQTLCTSNCYGSCGFDLLCLMMSNEESYCVPKSFSACGKQTCDPGEACWGQSDCIYGDCINVTGSGAPNHSFCSVECSDGTCGGTGMECIQLSGGSSWCIP